MTELLFHEVPEPGLIEAAAREIAARHRAELPNLASLTVLLPNLRATAAMEAALRVAAGVPVLLLPAFATLRGLAATVPLDIEPVPDSRRAAMVYEALRERDWFSGADLWHVAGELLSLFDELTHRAIPLPDSMTAFVERLEEAYRARAGTPMQFEARLVHELWYALHHSLEGRTDAAACYQLRLAGLVEGAAAPLYAVGLADLSPAEERFFEAWAERQPVVLFRRQGGANQPDARCALLEAAWPEPSPSKGEGWGGGEVESHNLRESAAAFRAACPATPLPGTLALFGAASLEEEAGAADAKVRQWLLAGKRHVAVVAQDRLAARRARALLERAGVLVEDETGWTLSTVAASTVVARWLDALTGNFYYQELLDLLKSPFVLADWPAGRRKQAVFELERLVRAHSVVSHLEHYRRLAETEGGGADLMALLGRLADARGALGQGRRGLSAWLRALLDSLNILGVTEGLTRDAAGEQLLALFARLQAELDGDPALFSLGEWRQWLNRQLESDTFRDENITSPVVLTHLAATRLRRFDAVLLLGCDAAHLPARGRDGAFFNQAVRASLGLPTREDALRQEREDLIGLIARCPEVFVTWQASRNAEDNLVSPYFERLEAFHRIAYGAGLRDGEWAARLPFMRVAGDVPGSLVLPAGRPAPVLPPGLVPKAITASGYNSLMACPYQYYARHALKLNEPDEVRLELEKKDFGIHVHKILKRFHERFPVVLDQDRARLERVLGELTDQAFAEAVEANYLDRAWMLCWRAAIPAYLEWQLDREQAGWRWRAGEVPKALDIELGSGHSLTLKGRLDRVDGAGTGEEKVAVLDYKTQPKAALKKKLERPGEDVQLPVYALLLGGEVSEAAFVSLERGAAGTVAFDGDVNEAAEQARERLRAVFDALYRGAPLPAQGGDEVCGYCEMSGLCRRDYWSDNTA